MIVLLLVLIAVVEATRRLQDFVASSSFSAGVAKVDSTPPVGVPLAGYNHGARRVPYWPLPSFARYTTWMTPSKGRMPNDGIFVRALVMKDSSGTAFAMVTLDGIGSDGTLNAMAFDIAKGMGFTLPYANCTFHGSHSHSGPGAISPDFLWSVAPATDLLVPEIQRLFATNMAKAMVQAQQQMRPALFAMGSTQLIGVTRNRRGKISPVTSYTTIDPDVALLRIDDAATGNRMVTVWNFAVHGVCNGPDNLYFTGDIMGVANRIIETSSVGGLAMFVNADAGDIDPAPGMCDNAPMFVGSQKMAAAVLNATQSLQPSDQVSFTVSTVLVDFGPTNLNATLGRFDNCTSGGPLDVCTICRVLGCDANVHMPAAWITNKPRFTAVAIEWQSTKNVIVTLPGEPLLELGWIVRNDTLRAGYSGVTFLAGYSQDHMGYFATPIEYDIGGYESELTFWGINTTERIREGIMLAVSQL